MKRQQIENPVEDIIFDVSFILVLILIGFIFCGVVIKNLSNGDFGWAIFGSACGAVCFFASWLMTRNVWSTYIKK